MAAKLVIAPEAELDIAEAYVWSEGRRAGPGEKFLSSVEACMESIRRFQYAIFSEHAETTLTASVVFHASRNPRKRQRLP